MHPGVSIETYFPVIKGNNNKIKVANIYQEISFANPCLVHGQLALLTAGVSSQWV